MFKRPDFSPTTLFRENKNDLTCIFAENTWFSLPACSRFVPKFTLHLTLKVKVSWHWNDASFQKWTQPSNWGRPRAFGPFRRKGTVYYDRAFRESAPLLQGPPIHPVNSSQRKEGTQDTKDNRKWTLFLHNPPGLCRSSPHWTPKVSSRAKCNIFWCLFCNFMAVLLAYFSFQGNMQGDQYCSCIM